MSMTKINVKNTNVIIVPMDDNNYISFTDIEKNKSDTPTAVISNWMRNRNTIEYERTNAIGIVSRAGRYGGTYAHKGYCF